MACEVYPPNLVKAILEGLIEELVEAGEWHAGEIGTVDAEEPGVDWDEYMDLLPEVAGQRAVPGGHASSSDEKVTNDAITGLRLDPKLVQAAKSEEIGQVYDEGSDPAVLE